MLKSILGLRSKLSYPFPYGFFDADVETDYIKTEFDYVLELLAKIPLPF